MDGKTIYYALRDAAERYGFVGDAADDLLGQAAQAIADDPRNGEGLL
jgi:hypothetical protein